LTNNSFALFDGDCHKNHAQAHAPAKRKTNNANFIIKSFFLNTNCKTEIANLELRRVARHRNFSLDSRRVNSRRTTLLVCSINRLPDALPLVRFRIHFYRRRANDD
jgi:hypothetical protein